MERKRLHRLFSLVLATISLGIRSHHNHYLFSDYYLTHRVAERQEWMELDARPHLHALRRLVQSWRSALVNANEAQTEADWIRSALSLLGHHFTTQVSLATLQGVKTPDYILCPDEATRTAVQTLGRPAVEADLAAALAVADTKAWDRPLDRSLPGAGVATLHQHPGWQYEVDGKSILRTWTPVYRFEMDAVELMFRPHCGILLPGDTA